MQINVDLIYPIGSLYITTDTTFNPNIKFGGTWARLEGDVYLNRNILDETVTESTYFSARKSNFNNEWILKIGTDGYLDNIVVGSDHEELIMCGVSYWNQEDGEFLKAKLEQAVEQGGFEQLFWDNLVKDSLDELKIKVRELKSDDLFEIDSWDELNELEELLQNK